MPWPGKDGRAPEAGLNCEWLVTNGLGGYASGTLSGVITRRYHGLSGRRAARSVRPGHDAQ